MELPPVAKITGTNVKEFARCAFAFRKLIPALPNEHSSITWSANIYTAFAGNVTNVSSHVSMQTDLFVFEKQGKYIYIRGIASLQTSWITAEYYFRLMSLLIRKINSLYRGNNQIYRRVRRGGEGERSIGKKKNSLDFPSFLPFPLPSPPPPISKITE